MSKQLVNKKEVEHWLGNSYEEWIHDFIYRLVNKKCYATLGQVGNIDSINIQRFY